VQCEQVFPSNLEHTTSADHTAASSQARATPLCKQVFFNNQEHTINVRRRPHLSTFMERVAELFEVVVFTASQKIYAEVRVGNKTLIS